MIADTARMRGSTTFRTYRKLHVHEARVNAVLALASAGNPLGGPSRCWRS